MSWNCVRMTKSPMYRILSVSRDDLFLLNRNDVLAAAGFSVISPREPEDTTALAAGERVHAVIIGHSVEPPLRRSIIEKIRAAYPQCIVCFVYAAPQATGEPLADVSVDVTREPERLIIALQERLPNDEARAS